MKRLNSIFKMDKKNRHQILLWLIGGLILTFATEIFLRGSIKEVVSWVKETPGVMLANYLLILMLTSIFFLAKRKYMVYFISFVVILGVSITTFFLMKVRGTPLTFSDLYSIGEAFGSSQSSSFVLPYLILHKLKHTLNLQYLIFYQLKDKSLLSHSLMI